jgi:lipopolysaccharide/colanic/teichoic acid biosynthesis glycosyltransferase
MDSSSSIFPYSNGARVISARARQSTLEQAAPSTSHAGDRPASTATAPHDDFEPRPRSETVSRIFNCVIAAVMLLVASPVMLVTVILIRLTSRGPVLYTQVRVGLDRRWNSTRSLNERRWEDLGGSPFTILKFRSMREDAEVNGQAVWARQDDDRVTPIGTFIRKTRIDELPQLLNVIRGDMNIVGPRPERPSIFVRLREQISEYPVRQRVKPGITGLHRSRTLTIPAWTMCGAKCTSIFSI